MNITDAELGLSGLSAAATAVLAVTTYRQAKSTKDSAEATKLSAIASESAANATRASVEKLNDNLRPMVGVHEVRTVLDSESPSLVITATNYGVGPGLIRQITCRPDVDPSVVLRLGRGVVLRPGDSTSFSLALSRTENIADRLPKTRFASSLSIWYEDVFGRPFRDRVVFAYGGSLGQEPVVLGREQLPVLSLPVQMGDFHAAGSIETYEFGRAVPLSLTYEDLYFRSSVVRLTGAQFPGNEITGGRSVTLLDLDFWAETAPALTMQVDGFKQVVLWVADDHDQRNERRPMIVIGRGIEGHQPGLFASYPKITDEDLRSIGLAPTTEWASALQSLHAGIVRQAIRRLRTPT